MAKERGGNGGKDSGSGNEGVTSSSKVKLDWKKRVRFEYKRLREQRKFRYQEDIKVSWRKNKAKMEAKFLAAEAKVIASTSEVPNTESATNSTKRSYADRHQPFWAGHMWRCQCCLQHQPLYSAGQ